MLEGGWSGFIKPHAVTDKVRELAMAGLKKAGLKIVKERSIKADVLDKKRLIDQRYHAIASKATSLKPENLKVPAAAAHRPSSCELLVQG